MADNLSQLKTEVRNITDFGTADLSGNDLDTVVSVAKREIEGVADRDIADWFKSNDKELALFWTACLFCKVKAGELDGVTMTLGDMEVETLRAAGESSNDNAVIWYERAMTYAERLMASGAKYGHRQATRSGERSYGADTSGGSL